MKKIIAILLIISVCAVCVVFAGCSDDTSGDKAVKPSESSSTVDEATKAQSVSTADESGKKYSSIEEYISDPEIKEAFDATKESMRDLISFEYHAEGNKLIYDYTYLSHYEGAVLDNLKKSLEESLESNSESYSQIVDGLREKVNENDPQLVINYRNDDGSIIVTETFD